MGRAVGCTLVVITRDCLVRADVRAGRVIGAWQQARPAVEDLPSLVEAALRTGPKRCGRVWVLASDLWTQTLSLPAESVAGLNEPELERALAFEAEPLSGVSAFDARIAYVELPADAHQRRFWLTALAASPLEGIECAVEQAGGRLVAVGHPGGVPRWIGRGGAHRELAQRVELWPDAVFCMQWRDRAAIDIRVLNVDPKPERWLAEVQQCFEATPPEAPRELVCATRAVAVEPSDANQVLDLADPGTLEAWLGTWAEAVADKAAKVPLVRPAKRPLSEGKRRALAIGLALGAIAICSVHHLSVEAHKHARQRETLRLLEPKKQLDSLRKQAAELRKRHQALEAEVAGLRERLDRCDLVMAAQRQRFARLLAVLARCAQDGIVVRKIDAAGDTLAIHGVCLRPELANGLAAALDRAIAPLGWQAEPPDKEACELLADGAPWQFVIRIRQRTGWQPQPIAAELARIPTAAPADFLGDPATNCAMTDVAWDKAAEGGRRPSRE